mmetsp:Transcript_57214/g.167439  ORF Transcript_57214/g.167439 Transcript_57214/m.167439 type:complete len:210 (-) Transcript_57214:252-881(-)
MPEELQGTNRLCAQLVLVTGPILGDVGLKHGLENQETRGLRQAHDATEHDQSEQARAADHETPALGANIGENVARQETQEDAQNDDGLLGGDQHAAHSCRGDLRDVNRRSVHGKANAKAVDQEAEEEPPQHWHRSRHSSAGEVAEPTYLHLQLPTNDVCIAEADQRGGAGAEKVQRAQDALGHRRQVVALAITPGPPGANTASVIMGAE